MSLRNFLIYSTSFILGVTSYSAGYLSCINWATHGTNQQGQGTYTISMNNSVTNTLVTEWSPSNTYIVSLHGSNYRGIIVAPFFTSNKQFSDPKAGSFSVIRGDNTLKLMTSCTGGLSHTNANGKTTSRWLWTPPHNSTGPVTIFAVLSITQNGNNFQVTQTFPEAVTSSSITPTFISTYNSSLTVTPTSLLHNNSSLTVTPTSLPRSSSSLTVTSSSLPRNSSSLTRTSSITRTATSLPRNSSSLTRTSSFTRTATSLLRSSSSLSVTSTSLPSISSSVEVTPTSLPSIISSTEVTSTSLPSISSSVEVTPSSLLSISSSIAVTSSSLPTSLLEVTTSSSPLATSTITNFTDSYQNQIIGPNIPSNTNNVNQNSVVIMSILVVIGSLLLVVVGILTFSNKQNRRFSFRNPIKHEIVDTTNLNVLPPGTKIIGRPSSNSKITFNPIAA